MKFTCFTDWDQLPEGANALFELAEKNSLFFSHAWFENLLTEIDTDKLVFACVINETEILALLPLLKSDNNTLHALKHRYTTHYSLLVTDKNTQPVITCLIEGLNNLSVPSLLLEPVADDDENINRLHHGMVSTGYECESIFRFYNWIYRPQGQSYQEYLSARPARLRNTIARKKRKLDREHGYRIKLYTGDDAVSAMPDYYAAYDSSWKAKEQYVSFLNAMVERFSKRDWSRLAILYVNEQPVAAQLWFVAHKKASIFRLAYNQDWKRYSPGSILTGYLMEYVIDIDKVDEVDFLTGNDAYKQDWMSERRQRYALSCVKKHSAKNNARQTNSQKNRLQSIIEDLGRRLKRL